MALDKKLKEHETVVIHHEDDMYVCTNFHDPKTPSVNFMMALKEKDSWDLECPFKSKWQYIYSDSCLDISIWTKVATNMSILIAPPQA